MGLAGVHRGAADGDHRNADRPGFGGDGVIGQVHGLAPAIADRAEDGDFGGRLHVVVLDPHQSGDAAGRDQIGRPEPGRAVGLELVRRIARAAGHQDLVAGEQKSTAAVRALDALVLTDPLDARDDQVAGLEVAGLVVEPGDVAVVDAAGGKGRLDLGEAGLVERLHVSVLLICRGRAASGCH